MPEHILDTVIIGGGPAGLAVAHTLHQEGIDYQVYEQGPIAWHIAQYPTFMRFFSTNENLEIADFPLGISDEKPSRQQYLKYLAGFARYHHLKVRTYIKVNGVERGENGVFTVELERQGGRKSTVHAYSVVVAVGAWDVPRKLDVPGAELEKVSYRYTEPHDYLDQKVLVVGGRNSAIETALQLWRAGADVTLCYRRKEFTGRGVKYWLRPDIENRIKKGEIKAFLGAHVKRIDWETVEIEKEDGEVVTIENDFVLPMLGYDPPVDYLKSLGIELEPETNKPEHNPDTLETNVPGMFIAGVITYGNISGHVFIENSRHHGEMMLPRLKNLLEERKTVSA